MICRIFVFLLSLSLLVIVPDAWTQDDGPGSESPSTKIYKELQQEIIRLKEADGVRDRVIKNLIRRIEQLERSSAANGGGDNQPMTHVDEGEQKELTPELQERMRRESEENYQLIQKAFEQRLEREGGMLLAPFTLTYEPRFSYAHASYDSIVVDGFTIFPVLVIGDIVSEKIRHLSSGVALEHAV